MIKRKNIVVCITALAVVLSSGVIAFAAADTNSQIEKARPSMMANLTDAQRESVQLARTDSMKEAVKELVESGIITQEEADKLPEVKVIQKFECEANPLTEEQRTALQEEQKAVFESMLTDLVADGTLTQDQADQMEQGKGMKLGLDLTEEQREAVMQAKISAMKTAAANLVEEGTITQEEADALTAMPVRIKAHEIAADSILNEDQRTALQEAVKTKLENKLAELVDDGTLTQELADQLLNDRGGLHMGPGGKRGQGFCGRPDADVQLTETEDTTL